MKKRFPAIILALALCMGLCAVPAFAADTTSVTANGITFDAIVTDRYESWKSASEDSSLGPEAEFNYHLGYQAVWEEGVDDVYGVASFYTYLVDHDVTLDFNVKTGEQFYVEGYYLSVVSSQNASVPVYDLAYMGGGTFTATEDDQVLDKALIDEYYPGANCLFLFRGSGTDASFDKGVRVVFADENGDPETIPAFTDVKKGIWYENAVNWAAANGVAQGTGNNKFSPAKDCTHEQILTFLYRAQNKVAASTGDMEKALDWAKEQGITGEGFDPKAKCTRADAVYYIWQAMGSETPEKAAEFTDVDADADYAQAVSWAVEQGVVKGTGGNRFTPDKVCNRGTIATMLYQAYYAYA